MQKKKAATSSTKKKKSEMQEDLLPHYDFDYAKAKPNRFARRKQEQMLVLLDSDITRTFRTPEQVTHALRSLIEAMPQKQSRS